MSFLGRKDPIEAAEHNLDLGALSRILYDSDEIDVHRKHPIHKRVAQFFETEWPILAEQFKKDYPTSWFCTPHPDAIWPYDKFLELYRPNPIEIAADYPATLEGYLEYLWHSKPAWKAEVLSQVETEALAVCEADRRAHTLITGGSQSGKSELLKRLIHHYVKHPEIGGVLVVDPHGKLARQVARWKEFSGDGMQRLVYIDAKARQDMGGLVPPLNPIQRGAAPDGELANVALQLASTLASFAEGHTPNMERVAEFIFRILLTMEGSTLADFADALTPPDRRRGGQRAVSSSAVARRGREHPNGAVRRFFLNDFDREGFTSSRDALARRLSSPLAHDTFAAMMTAPDPLNLECLLGEGKVVVVNTATLGGHNFTMAQMVVAQVAAMGAWRLADPFSTPTRVHVFIDEATEIMSDKLVHILEAFAKTGIWLTMSQQGAGEGGTRDFVGRVTRSTHLKFLASGKLDEVRGFVDVARDALPPLSKGMFVVVKRGQERAPLLLNSYPSPLAEDANAMSEAEWQAVLDYQLATYYRSPLSPAAPSKRAEPEDEPVPWRER